MIRTSAFLAIALCVTAIGSATTPAAALTLQSGGAISESGASPRLKPLEVDAGQLPRPILVPKTRPSYCMEHNCFMPRNFDR